MLAGISVEYYVRLERGNLSGASESVLDALARALQLDDAERTHLHDLARLAGGRAPSSPASRTGVRPALAWMLQGMTGTAAYIRNARTDILAANPLATALYSPIFSMRGRPNVARFVFLEPAAHDFFTEWDTIAHEAAAMLRSTAATNPYDVGLTQLVGELSTRSDLFAQLWATHDVRLHRTGVKKFHHPTVGALALSWESFDLATDPGLRMNAYVAEPGGPSADALALLASWTAPAVAPPQAPTLVPGDDDRHAPSGP